MIYKHLSSLDSNVVRGIALICLADGIVGISYGSLAIGFGFELWVPLALSLLVLAGASEFLFIGIVASGGSPFAAAAAGLLVNARHMPFGMAVKEVIERSPLKLLGCHIMNDESVVFGISQPTLQQRIAAYWLCGLGIALCWPLGVIIGTTIGNIIPNINTIGLDAVFPTILLALIVGSLKKSRSRISAISGSLISLVAVPFVPIGMPVLFSLLGLLIRKRDK